MSGRRSTRGREAWVLVLALSSCGDRADRAAVSSARPPAATSGVSMGGVPSGGGPGGPAAFPSPTRPGAASGQAANLEPIVPIPTGLPVRSEGLLELAAVEVPAGERVTERDVREAIDAKRSELSLCVKEATSATVTGKVMQSGSFQEVQVTKAQPDDARVRDCLAAVLRNVRFPNARPGEPALVRMRLSVKGGER